MCDSSTVDFVSSYGRCWMLLFIGSQVFCIKFDVVNSFLDYVPH
jgi:hypothetical protein